MEDIDELAADVRHAGDLARTACAVQFVQAGIPVVVYPTLVIGEVSGWMLALAIDRQTLTKVPLLVGWRLIEIHAKKLLQILRCEVLSSVLVVLNLLPHSVTQLRQLNGPVH